MENREHSALRIKEALHYRDKTQADLCRMTGIPKSAMSQYANGSLLPRQDRIYLIAKALNVSEAWLMGFDVPMEKMPLVSTEDNERLQEFIRVFTQLTSEQQSMIIAQIQGILSAL